MLNFFRKLFCIFVLHKYAIKVHVSDLSRFKAEYATRAENEQKLLSHEANWLVIVCALRFCVVFFSNKILILSFCLRFFFRFHPIQTNRVYCVSQRAEFSFSSTCRFLSFTVSKFSINAYYLSSSLVFVWCTLKNSLSMFKCFVSFSFFSVLLFSSLACLLLWNRISNSSKW